MVISLFFKEIRAIDCLLIILIELQGALNIIMVWCDDTLDHKLRYWIKRFLFHLIFISGNIIKILSFYKLEVEEEEFENLFWKISRQAEQRAISGEHCQARAPKGRPQRPAITTIHTPGAGSL